jgi:Arc/MetJ-type ribon-helix-helix transcriptional regulator
MEIHLTPDQEAFVREAVASGRVQRAEEAVEQAMLLWERRERSRLEILAALDASELDLREGRFTEYSKESLPKLADELKQEARRMRRREISA